MIGERIKDAFRGVPVTSWFITTNLVVWLLNFFGVPEPMLTLGGELDLAHAWRWLTYSVASPTAVIWLLFGLWCFFGFASSLERAWGSQRFARVFLLLVLCSAGALWLAHVFSAQTLQVLVVAAGFWFPMGALVMIWASLNRNATIMLMAVVPVVAKWIALATVVLVFFSPAGPLYGLPFALFYAGCWKWAERYGGGMRPASGSSRPGRLQRWWAERQKAKRLSRFQLLEGGSASLSPTRSGHLDFAPKESPKDDRAQERELDRILDKIRFEGMASLSEDERATLDGQSRRLRGDV